MNLDENKSKQLMEAVLKMHRLELEKKQAMSEYTSQINDQKEWVYKLAEQMQKNQPDLFAGEFFEAGDGEEEPIQEADFAVLEEPVPRIGGEVLDPETGEITSHGPDGKVNGDTEEHESEGTGEAMEEVPAPDPDPVPTKKQDHCKDCPSTYDAASTICCSCPHVPGKAEAPQTNQQDEDDYTVGDEF